MYSRWLLLTFVTAWACGGSDSATTLPSGPSSNPSVLEIISGDQQRGLTGRALADSLIVRARTASGAAVAGVAVNWTSSSGTLSTASTVTDATGTARVQWIAGAGDATAAASLQGSAAVTFRANGRANGACVLTPSAQTQRFSLGATDFTLSLRATSPHKIVALFVDFSDAPTTETPQSVMGLIVDPGVALMKELSYNRTDITVTPVAKWYRMSKTSASYSWSTFAGHRAFFQEALALADADVDFSPYDAVYVFASANAAQVVSPTFNGGQSNGFTFDGRVFGNGVTFGQDSRRFGPAILAHETHHMLGLVDLYSYDPAAGTPYQGNQFRDVGAWSLMSNVFTPGHTFAWEKRKLGFLDDAQVDCLEGTPGGEEAIIQPVETVGGRKMIGIPLDANRALVVEVRSNQGLDANLCSQGVLIYEVNAAAASGVDPVKIRGSRVSTSGAAFARCGPWADATFGVGSSDISLFTDAASGVSVRVLAAESGGAYRVRVKR